MGTATKKVVIVGDGYCGKTSIVRRFAERSTSEQSLPTVLDVYSTEIIVTGRHRPLTICDTPGTLEWSQFRTTIYSGADIVILAFDLSDKDTLENVLFDWVPEVKRHCPEVPFILVGNKLDLRKKTPSCVDQETGECIARRICAKQYVECSALTGEGIKKLFDSVGEILFTSRRCAVL